MDWNNVTLGNLSVKAIHMGNIKIWPQNIFTVKPTSIDVDSSGHYEEIVVTSVYGGAAASVNVSVLNDDIGLGGLGYTDGPNLGERIYYVQIPYNSTYEDREATIRFTQPSSGLYIDVDIWQEMYM